MESIPESAPTSGVERARAALAGGHGVLVVGEPGAGRTHFVRSVLALLDEATRSALWVAEDIDRLDPAQAAGLARSIRSGRVMPLATVQRRRPLGPELEQLWRDGLVQRIELAPLAPAAVLGAVQTFLGGALDPLAVPHFVPARPGGDLVVLQEAVREARSSRVLVEEGGLWRLTAPLPPSEGLRRLVRSRLEVLTPLTVVSTTALELIGSAPELGLAAVEGLVRELEPEAGDVAAALERLEEDGVLDVLDGAGGLRLRLHDPVVELVLPQTIGLLRRQRLAAAVVGLLGRVPVEQLGAGELLALARHTSALGLDADPATLVGAARAALRSAQAELALQLATTAVVNGGGIDAELTAATAEAQISRFGEALARLEGLGADPALDEHRCRTVEELARLVRMRRDVPSFGWNMPSRSALDDQGADLLSLLRPDSLDGAESTGRRESTAGTSQGASPGLRASVPDADRTAIAVLEGERLAQAAGLAALTGELSRMNELLDAGEAILGPVGADMFRLQLSRAIARGFDGGIEDALETVLRYRSSAAALGRPGQQASSGWFAGGLLLAAGRAAEAVPVLRECRELMERHGLDEGAAFARADLAIALATIGEEAEASALRATLGTGDEHPRVTGRPRPGILLEGRSQQVLGWMHASAGRSPEAAAAFIRAADAHGALGHHLQVLLALVEAARAGAAREVAGRVDDVARRVEGESLVVSARHARALARLAEAGAGAGGGTRPPTSLAEPVSTGRSLAVEFGEIAQAAAGAGLHMVAAEAFDRASLLHSRGSDERAAAAARRLSDAEAALCGFSPLPFLGRAAPVRLSERERELAGLAAAGLSNREIAERLVLSVRTVETHLQRVYRKLGVRSRAELAAAILR